MEKLRDTCRPSVTINNRNGHADMNNNSNETCTLKQLPKTDITKTNYPKTKCSKKVPFSERFFRADILTYDLGRWTAKPNGTNFKFHSSRNTNTLVVRAKNNSIQ